MIKNLIRFLVVFVCLNTTVHAAHSFTIISVNFGLTNATFTGEPTDVSALGIPMEGRVCNLSNTTMYASASTHTFTSVGEQFIFTVNYPSGTFSSGTGIVSVTDVLFTTDCNDGNQGSINVFPNPQQIPTMSVWGLGILAGLLGLIGFVRRRKV